MTMEWEYIQSLGDNDPETIIGIDWIVISICGTKTPLPSLFISWQAPQASGNTQYQSIIEKPNTDLFQYWSDDFSFILQFTFWIQSTEHGCIFYRLESSLRT